MRDFRCVSLLRYSLVLLFGVILISFTWSRPRDKYFEIIKSLDLFISLFKELNTYYVDELSPLELVDKGIEAMLATLDPYTKYFSEDNIESYRSSQEVDYAHIGIEIFYRKGSIFVSQILEGSSAEKAGLQIGDELLTINNLSLEGKTAEEVQLLLKGQAYSTLTLTLRHPLTYTSLEMTLQRELFQQSSVPYYAIIDSLAGIGYIELTEFTPQASQYVYEALLSLKGKGMKRLVLDLRGNPGGLLTEAVEISNFFLPQDIEIVRAKSRVEEWNKVFYAKKHPLDLEMPVVVLVDEHSASASEILAGALQDYDRGVILGHPTYGKGLVQVTLPLVYNAQLKVTTARYYTPSGRCIQSIDYFSSQKSPSSAAASSASKQTFYTTHGRRVYDKGGITPDILLSEDARPPILELIQHTFLLFDYATIYRKKYADIPQPLQFSMSSLDYQAFKKWLLTQDTLYYTSAYHTLRQLESQLQQVNTYDTALQNHVHHIRNTLKQRIKATVNTYEKNIQALLEQEILRRYYSKSKCRTREISEDRYIKRAKTLLTRSEMYHKLLQPKK